MHKTLYIFRILVKNIAIFPNYKGPGPIPKKGCESPDSQYIYLRKIKKKI